MELVCSVQNYHWGKKGKNSLVGRFAQANSGINLHENKNYAELWMGTHPNGPSHLKIKKISLSQHLDIYPKEFGSKILHNFGVHIPFLLKILSVEEPLSIQAHPSKSDAEELNKKFPDIYKDDNHKPELAIALTNFEALCGFRPKSEIKFFLKNIPEFTMLIDQNIINNFLEVSEENKTESTKAMKECFQSLMLSKEEKIIHSLETMMRRLETFSHTEKKNYLFDLVRKLYYLFPNDVGVLCVYWLNYLKLSPGEALYLGPNEPHAYLYGDCIECMANSDNVVRAGLTPKFRDVSTLCEMLTYESHTPSEILFKPTKNQYCHIYRPPVKDFAVAKIILPKNCEYTLESQESASILVVTEGKGYLNDLLLEFGKVLYVPANTELCIKSDSIVLFQAFCNG